MAFGVKTNERPGTRAELKFARFSAYKAREVLNLIRNKPVAEAQAILQLTERGAAVLARVPAVHADDALVQALNALGPDKCEQLLALLRELLGAMPDTHETAGEIERTIGRMVG